MDSSQWLAFTGLIIAILVPAAMGIRRLGRIEANTETHAKQIKSLFAEVRSAKDDGTEHAKDCDTDRARIDERVAGHERRIGTLEGVKAPI